MLQHNPYSHTIRCAGLQYTLDAFETRELEDGNASLVPCVECDCQLMSLPAVKAPEPPVVEDE